jgi:hypothetical protein
MYPQIRQNAKYPASYRDARQKPDHSLSALCGFVTTKPLQVLPLQQLRLQQLHQLPVRQQLHL